MDIYIGNLPNQLQSSELRKIVKTVLLPTTLRELIRRLINKKDQVFHGEYQIIENHRGDGAECFAHAVITPDHIARRALRRLDHLTLQGNSLRVREYVARCNTNERRSHQGKNLYAVSIYNRRISERRLQLID